MNKLIFLILLLLTLFTSCASNKPIGPYNRIYHVNFNSPYIPAGTIEAQFDKSVSDLSKAEIEVLYYPAEDAVCLKYRYRFFTYYQFWDLTTRAEFVLALEKYKDDYTQRNFGRSSWRSKQKYAIINSYLYWQRWNFTPSMGNMVIDIGYSFKMNSPYFTVVQRSAHYDTKNRETETYSEMIHIYFTRNQADRLVELFDRNYLTQLVSGLDEKIHLPNFNIDVDDY